MKPLILLLGVAIAVQAADQKLTVAGKIKFQESAPTTGTLDFRQAAALIGAVLGEGHPAGDTSYLLHVVKYQDASLAVQEQHWYVYNKAWRETGGIRSLKILVGRGSERELFRDSRLFGSSKLGLVYLHIVNGIPRTDAKKAAEGLCTRESDAGCEYFREPIPQDITAAQLCEQVRGDLNAIRAVWEDDPILNTSCKSDPSGNPEDERKKAASIWRSVRIRKNVFDLATKGANSLVAWKSQNDAAIASLNGDLVEQGANKLGSLSYRIEITKKTPQPIQDLKDIIGLALGAQAEQAVAKIKVRPMGFTAGALFETSYTTSTMDATAAYKDGDKTPEIGKNIFTNEKRYWYDFSLAVPIKTYNNFRYDQSGNSASVKKIEKVNVWALASLGYPRDLAKTHLQIIPVPVYGIPITGQPLKHHLFGGAVGLNKFNFFAGVQLDRKTFVHDFSQPLTGNNIYTAWRTHLSYGVNFPVSTVVNALKQKAK